MYNISEKSYYAILATLRKAPEIEKTILFGSRALGNDKKGSDIDLAIVGQNIDLQLCTKLSYTLNQELPIPYKIDIIDYTHLRNKELKNHIDTKGIVIYEV